jgi:hypothetical protein
MHPHTQFNSHPPHFVLLSPYRIPHGLYTPVAYHSSLPSPAGSPALCAIISRAAASSSTRTCSLTRNAAGSRLLAFSPTRKHSTPADSSIPLAICASEGLSNRPTITSPSGAVGSGSPSKSIAPLQSQLNHCTHPLGIIRSTTRSTTRPEVTHFASTLCRWKVIVPQNSRARICTGIWRASSVYQIQMLPRFFTTPSSAVGCTRMV